MAAMPYYEVPAPLEQPPLPYGLFSAATVIDFRFIDEGYPESAGIRYEYDCSTGVQTWPGLCGASTPDPVDITATIAFTGAVDGTAPDLVYSATIAITSTPPDRAYRVEVIADGDRYIDRIAGDGAPHVVYTAVSPAAGAITITDTVSGDQVTASFTQDVTTGAITADLPEPWSYQFTGVPIKNSPGDWAEITADPFVLVATAMCPPVGYTREQLAERARARLRRNEWAAVERLIWTGASNNRPALAGADTIVLGDGTTPVDIVTAVGELELWYGQTHTGTGPGVIHTTRDVAALARRFRLADRNGAVYRAPLDGIWSFGAGYPGTGPDGTPAPAGSTWAYMTSPVTVRRSPRINDGQGFTAAQNDWLWRAERIYVPSWHCAVAAVLVDLTANNTSNGAAA